MKFINKICYCNNIIFLLIFYSLYIIENKVFLDFLDIIYDIITKIYDYNVITIKNKLIRVII